MSEGDPANRVRMPDLATSWCIDLIAMQLRCDLAVGAALISEQKNFYDDRLSDYWRSTEPNALRPLHRERLPRPYANEATLVLSEAGHDRGHHLALWC